MLSPISRARAWNLEAHTRMSEASDARRAGSAETPKFQVSSSRFQVEEEEPATTELETWNLELETAPQGPLAQVISYFNKVVALSEMEVQRLLHNQWDIVTRSIQPVLWLLLFGGVFGRLGNRAGLTPDGLPYLDFITPGILAQSVLTISIFQGIMVIWERDQGTLQKFLVSPMPRSVLVLGKGIGSGVRGLVQALAISVLA